jgi:hypothetical protein
MERHETTDRTRRRKDSKVQNISCSGGKPLTPLMAVVVSKCIHKFLSIGFLSVTSRPVVLDGAAHTSDKQTMNSPLANSPVDVTRLIARFGRTNREAADLAMTNSD